MSLLFVLLLGIHVISLMVTSAILFQFWHVHADRMRMFRQLESKHMGGTIREHRILIILYLLSTALIVVGFISAFFYLQS